MAQQFKETELQVWAVNAHDAATATHCSFAVQAYNEWEAWGIAKDHLVAVYYPAKWKIELRLAEAVTK